MLMILGLNDEFWPQTLSWKILILTLKSPENAYKSVGTLLIKDSNGTTHVCHIRLWM